MKRPMTLLALGACLALTATIGVGIGRASSQADIVLRPGDYARAPRANVICLYGSSGNLYCTENTLVPDYAVKMTRTVFSIVRLSDDKVVFRQRH